GFDDAVWPDPAAPLEFTWNDASVGMEFYYVDISVDPAVPLRDRRKTVVVGRGRVGGSALSMSTFEWRRVRKMASVSAGALYWRVRATDRYRTLACASAVRTLLIDGGEWALEPLDLSGPSPAARWTHTGEGLSRFAIEISTDAAFPKGPRWTVVVPPRGVGGSEYAFSDRDLRRIALLATRNSAATLYWRVRGETSDRQFFTTSANLTTPAPAP
ncbi:MAG: hypothetical protein ACYTAN_18480, partial [Planctomycetota bacterium]